MKCSSYVTSKYVPNDDDDAYRHVKWLFEHFFWFYRLNYQTFLSTFFSVLVFFLIQKVYIASLKSLKIHRLYYHELRRKRTLLMNSMNGFHLINRISLIYLMMNENCISVSQIKRILHLLWCLLSGRWGAWKSFDRINSHSTFKNILKVNVIMM